jgi:hypothetical protein
MMWRYCERSRMMRIAWFRNPMPNYEIAKLYRPRLRATPRVPQWKDERVMWEAARCTKIKSGA